MLNRFTLMTYSKYRWLVFWLSVSGIIDEKNIKSNDKATEWNYIFLTKSIWIWVLINAFRLAYNRFSKFIYSLTK
jgi:selenophosphate synthase